MESLQNVLELIRLGVYMASIHLKDVFYSAPVHKNNQGCLSYFVEEYLKSVCTPNGYGPAMQIFTKISKIPFSIFREKSFLSVGYVDWWLVFARQWLRALFLWYFEHNRNFCISWIHIPPRQVLIHINSIHHLFRICFKLCPNDNYFNFGEKRKILNLCQEILWEDVFTIKFLSKLIANLVAAFPAVTSGPFYHRDLEMCKTKVLQQSNENHDVSVRLSSEAEKWEKDEKRN